MSEFAVIFLGCLIVGTCSFFFGFIPSEKHRLVANPNSCHPAVLPANALKSRSANLMLPSVMNILHIIGFPQIIAAVVKRIVVFVISEFTRKAAKNKAVHSDDPFMVNVTMRVETLSVTVPACGPIPLLQPIKICGINDGILTARKWNQAIRWVGRLNDLMALHAVVKAARSFSHGSYSRRNLQISRHFITALPLALLFLCPAAFSQQTTVTAHVKDPRGFDWQAATGLASIQCPGNSMPYNNRSPLTRTIPITGLSGTGTFSMQLWDTSQITDVNNAPLSCQWRMSFTDACQVATFSVLVTGVTGSGPVDLSTQINASSVNLSASCTPPGIVNSVTLGSLPPLFNTSVTGNPLNPSFTFAQISQTQNLFFASPNGSSGNPAFRAIVSADLPGGTGTVTSFSSGNLPPLFTTSVATPTTTPAQSFALSTQTANQIFAGPTSGGAVAPTFRSLVGADLPTPTASTLGGVFSKAAVTHQFFTQLANSGTFSSAQPAASDISGLNFTQIATASAAGCTTAGGSSFQTCDNTLTWSNSGFADTSYFPTCSGVDPRMQASGGDGSSGEVLDLNIRSFTSTQIVVTTTQLAARASKYDTVYCTGVHP